MLTPAVANAANAVTITNADHSVSLTQSESGAWTVSSYHDLPADLSKLRRLMQDLTSADIDRVVTRNAERIARLEFGSAGVKLTGVDGSTWNADFGKTSDRGGRYVSFDSAGDAPAYLSLFAASLDAIPKNWADSKLLSFSADDIAQITYTLPGIAPLTVSRETAESAWTSPDLAEGQQLKTTRLNSTLTSLSNLRFTDTAATDATDAVDAASSSTQRAISLITFDGQTVSINLARRAEQIIPREPPPSTDSEESSSSDTPPVPTTETIPAGPVFVKITGPSALSPPPAITSPSRSPITASPASPPLHSGRPHRAHPGPIGHQPRKRGPHNKRM
ncbi:MAG: DUF4340 domain-containing protein [Candidatus Synoicihabitans palmerolidicus]|nr:DUF4340 domain-containing protein [Candidatus Synoicihabitans palmerolidicus]